MSTEEVRAEAGWLALREPVDAAARAADLVDVVRALLSPEESPESSPSEAPKNRTTVHDLGCGSGSMARWLAPRLPGAQHWVLHDRDADLLARAAASPPERALDGAPVSIETRRDDISGLDADELAGAHLVTASALLDMLTADQLERLVDACAAAGCPVLITLSVTGRVDLHPPDPWDQRVGEAFNAHQRRTIAAAPLLGPDAVAAAVAGFRRRGRQVLRRDSPWRLGAAQRALATAWLEGWLGAACEQEPTLAAGAGAYARRRRAEAAAGELGVTVHHEDVLVLP